MAWLALFDRQTRKQPARGLVCRPARRRHPQPRGCRVLLECLEGRALPSILTVTTASDAVGHTGTSLRDAIATANADAASGTADTIKFASSLSGATITLAQGQLELSGAGGITITIDGSALSTPVAISADQVYPNATRAFQVDANVNATIIGLIIENGRVTGGSGGGILNNGTLTLDSDTIENNTDAGNGTTAADGGGVFSSGTLLVDDCTIVNNHSPNGYGGGIYAEGSATIRNTTLSGNSADAGGGISNGGAGGYPAEMSVVNCTLFGNSATYGGGIDNEGTVNISDCTLSGNSASQGGGVYNYNFLIITHGTVTNNTATSQGGGIYGAKTTLINTILAGNTAPSSPDILGTAMGNNNVIGTNDGMTGIQNGVNGNQVGTSANLVFPAARTTREQRRSYAN